MLPHTKELLIIGDTFCDIIALDTNLPVAWGTDTLAKQIKVLAGGSALNIAVHGATYSRMKLESKVKVHFLSSTGADFQGQICRDALNIPCLDASKVIVGERYRTGSCIVLSGATDRSFVTDRGCIRDLSVKWFNESDFFSDSIGHIHIGGFYNCDSLKSDVPELLKKSRYLDMTTSLNPQYDATYKWEGIQEICPYLTFFIANEDELTCITKLKEGSSLCSKAAVLIGWGCSVVIVTRGNEGAIAFERNLERNNATSIADCSGEDLRCTTHAAMQVIVADKTGAGDAFAGGFLVDWMMSQQVSSALRAGCVTGGAAVTQIGGSSCSFQILEAVDACSYLHDGVSDAENS